MNTVPRTDISDDSYAKEASPECADTVAASFALSRSQTRMLPESQPVNTVAPSQDRHLAMIHYMSAEKCISGQSTN